MVVPPFGIIVRPVLMFVCCGPIFLLLWPFFPTRSKWTLFPSGRYFRGRFFPIVDVFSVDLFSVDLFSEHRPEVCGLLLQNDVTNVSYQHDLLTYLLILLGTPHVTYVTQFSCVD